MPDVDISDEDADSPIPTPDSQQYLIDTIAQLEHKLQKALISIYSYQNERAELIDRIIEFKLKLQNAIDILEK
jgi:hypothetical protein